MEGGEIKFKIVEPDLGRFNIGEHAIKVKSKDGEYLGLISGACVDLLGNTWVFFQPKGEKETSVKLFREITGLDSKMWNKIDALARQAPKRLADIRPTSYSTKAEKGPRNI